MTSSETTERKAAKANHPAGAPPQSEPEQLPCPRCESTNTKFCYYNNYNFSQPRHFCKGCRRYWTRGGALRDIPVGGGSRKDAKRSRTLQAAAKHPNNFEYRQAAVSAAAPLLAPVAAADRGGSLPPFVSGGDAKPGGMSVCGTFTSLLNTHGPGFFTLGGFGLGLGAGGEEMGFGLGRAIWPFPGLAVAEGGGGADGAGGGPEVPGNTWQRQSVDGGIVAGDCFTLSDVAFSTAGHALK